jgi:hypothetical protein
MALAGTSNQIVDLEDGDVVALQLLRYWIVEPHMQKEIFEQPRVIGDSRAGVESLSLTTSSMGPVAVSDLRSARMEDMMRLPTTGELRAKMRVLGTSNDPALRTADFESKIAALCNYRLLPSLSACA